MPNNQPNKMWSGRFREPLNRTFEQWQRSFPFDWRLLPHEVAACKAHARVAAAAQLLGVPPQGLAHALTTRTRQTTDGGRPLLHQQLCSRML